MVFLIFIDAEIFPLIWSLGFDWSINSFLPAADVSFSPWKSDGSKWLLQLQSCGCSCYLSVACGNFLAASFDMLKDSSSFRFVYEDSLKISICADWTSSQCSLSLGSLYLQCKCHYNWTSTILVLQYFSAEYHQMNLSTNKLSPCFNHWFLPGTTHSIWLA